MYIRKADNKGDTIQTLLTTRLLMVPEQDCSKVLLLDITLQHVLLRHVGVPCIMRVPPISKPPPPPLFGVAEFIKEGFTRGWGT